MPHYKAHLRTKEMLLYAEWQASIPPMGPGKC